MALCPKCGSFSESETKFCPMCGANREQSMNTVDFTAINTPPAEPAAVTYEHPTQVQSPVPPVYTQPTASAHYPYMAQMIAPVRKLNVGMLIWSIISIYLTIPFFPFGIVSLINTIKAKAADSDRLESRLLRVARVCNIISIPLGVIVIVASFLYAYYAQLSLLEIFL